MLTQGWPGCGRRGQGGGGRARWDVESGGRGWTEGRTARAACGARGLGGRAGGACREATARVTQVLGLVCAHGALRGARRCQTPRTGPGCSDGEIGSNACGRWARGADPCCRRAGDWPCCADAGASEGGAGLPEPWPGRTDGGVDKGTGNGAGLQAGPRAQGGRQGGVGRGRQDSGVRCPFQLLASVTPGGSPSLPTAEPPAAAPSWASGSGQGWRRGLQDACSLLEDIRGSGPRGV